MDFFSNSHSNKPTAETTNKPHEHKTSTSELFASAKVLAEAAKGGEQKMDKDKVADAAGDLLCAASQYGKIDENSAVGKYVHKAEEYLHNYNSSSASHSSTTNSSHSTPNTNTSHSSSTNTHSNAGSEGHAESGGASHSSSTNTHSNAGSDGHAESGGGGYGDYMKMAEGLFKKH